MLQLPFDELCDGCSDVVFLLSQAQCLGSSGLLTAKSPDNNHQILAPIGLERKAQCDRWGSVGVVPIKLVGVEWIDHGFLT